MELRAPVLVEAGSQPWSCVLLCLLRQVLNRGAACYTVLVVAGAQPLGLGLHAC